MKDFNFSTVLGLMRKTAPFLLFRFLIYVGITLGFVLITGAGIGYGMGHIANNAPAGGAWGGLAGFGLALGIMYFLREYLLYMVKARHIAVLVEVHEGRAIPGGKGQIAYGTEQVRQRFATSSLLFGVDQLVKGILAAFNTVGRAGVRVGRQAGRDRAGRDDCTDAGVLQGHRRSAARSRMGGSARHCLEEVRGTEGQGGRVAGGKAGAPA